MGYTPMFEYSKRPLAVLTLLALAACGGGTSGNAFSGPAPAITVGGTGTPIAPQSGAAILTTIVGVGDSLTAGEQSNALMGENGTNPLSALPGGVTPATQENGFFSLLFQQAKGVSPASMYNPATSPLPLIHSPGLLAQLLPAIPAAGVPLFQTHPGCDTFNQQAFALSGALGDRISPAQTVTDVAVPGITMHEALYMTGPTSGPPPGPTGTAPNQSCPGYPALPGDPTSGGLQTIVQAENTAFLPVLGGFAGSVSPLTMVNAAVSTKPTLATVLLGANDLLTFIFSAGTAPTSDTPAQLQADMTATIKALQNAGARVVVSNLPDVLSSAQFFPGGAANPNPQSFDSQFQAFAGRLGVPAAPAKGYGDALAAQLQTNYSVGIGGYLTESGFLAVLSAGLAELKGGQPPVLPNLDPSGPRSGTGSAYLPDTFATTSRNLNLAYNGAITAAASATGAPLVDLYTTFQNITAFNYPAQFVNPPKCCFAPFGGGIFTFDGLHPSNTGYALIANEFIKTINAAYSLSIPAVNVSAVYNGTAPYLLPDPYAQH